MNDSHGILIHRCSRSFGSFSSYLFEAVLIVTGSFPAICRSANKVELENLEKKIVDSKEKFGEVEIADAISKKAAFFSRIGDKVSRN